MSIVTQFLEKPIFRILGEVAAERKVRAFVIGGYVRDCFLGRPCNDIDVVVEGSGIDFAEAVGKRLHKRVSYFKNFGTAMLRFEGDEIEFVGARKESYRRESRKPIVEDGTIEDDQMRRDFTINAMAFTLQKDDFGALSTKDLTFRIVPESMESMRRMADRLSILSRERIAEELDKMLVTDRPSLAFHLLDSAELLPRILPELSALKGVETVDGRGHKDNFAHTLAVTDNIRREDVAPQEGRDHLLWLRWAALLHDIGKPASKRYDKAAGWTFHGHDVIGARMVPPIFRRLALSMDEMKYVSKLVRLHLRPIALVDDGVTDSAVRRLLFDAGDDIDDLMLLCNADITSKNETKVARIKANFELVRRKLVEVEEKDAIRNFKNPISGEYVMQVYGIPPCKEIGELKEMVKEAILDGVIGNDFAEADAYMRLRAPELGLNAVER